MYPPFALTSYALSSFALAPLVLATTAVVATLPSQDPRAPTYRTQQFVPAEYVGRMQLDRKRIEDVGLWDSLARSPLMGLADGEIRALLGVGIEDIDSLQVFPGPHPDKQPGDDLPHYRGTLMVLRGAALTLARMEAASKESPNVVERAEVGGIDVVSVRSSATDPSPMRWLSPEAGVLVMGDAYLIDPVLQGVRRGVGVPYPDLMPLLGKPGTVAEFAFYFPAGAAAENMRIPLMDDQLAASDPLMAMAGRLVVTGDGDDVTFEATIDFKEDDVNAPVVRDMVREQLKMLAGHRQYGALKALWNAVQVEQDGNRVQATLPLGDADAAARTLSQLAALAMFMVGGELQAVEAAVPAPAAPKAPKAGGGI